MKLKVKKLTFNFNHSIGIVCNINYMGSQFPPKYQNKKTSMWNYINSSHGAWCWVISQDLTESLAVNSRLVCSFNGQQLFFAFCFCCASCFSLYVQTKSTHAMQNFPSDKSNFWWFSTQWQDGLNPSNGIEISPLWNVQNDNWQHWNLNTLTRGSHSRIQVKTRN